MLLLVFIFLFSLTSYSLDSTTMLPRGIYSPGWRQGYIFSANQKYTANGDLYHLSDLNSVELNVSKIQTIEPDIKKLEYALNKFGQNELGSSLHLGVLKVSTEPTIQYSVPLFARGITDQWMIGIGVPIIRYSNKLSFTHSGSNIGELRRQFYGSAEAIDEAFDRLDQNLTITAQQTLQEKGYKPIQDRHETFLGDIQLASFYLFYQDTQWSWRWQSYLNLPTGPQDDPNDLTDLSTFGRTSWENSLLANVQIGRQLVLALKGGHKWNVPDRVRMRVPINAQDTLPDQTRLARVERNTGDAYIFGGSATYTFTNGFGMAAGVEHIQKESDFYSGSLAGDYSFMSQNTQSFSQRVQYELSYDTTALYFAKKALIPMVLSANISDTFRGKNVERLSQTEFSATLFF